MIYKSIPKGIGISNTYEAYVLQDIGEEIILILKNGNELRFNKSEFTIEEISCD